MKILFCRIGWCKYYNGDPTDPPVGGGSYNDSDIGHEIYNFKPFEGEYYGFVRAKNDTINVSRLEADAIDKTENVLVVWVSEQVLVGWYNNATIYRDCQKVPSDAKRMKGYTSYNITADDAVLLPEKEREFPIEGIGQSNVWYAENNDAIKSKVIDYITNYDAYKVSVSKIEIGLSDIEGKEKEAIVKVRINQDRFRDGLIKKYGNCCLCGVKNENLLIASHLKPWSVSNNQEKVDLNNGLLLCPNHDKLVDSGLISFSETGKVIISKCLSKRDRDLLNISRDMKIEVTDDNAPYVSYHRENIFQEE
ncbi:MAG: HNH endonuclease [Bacteroidales bacterium]|nr:HNH endonuclease [Bacteroidales bacterium]